MRAAFIDRDGTIIRDYPDELWRGRTDPEFLPGAVEGLRALAGRGFELLVITNQYLINELIISEVEYRRMTEAVLCTLSQQGVRILDVFFCPHARDEGCPCMKPRIGMIDQALARYPEISLERSIVVGDSVTDMELAITLGMRGFAVGDSAWIDHPLVTSVSGLLDVAVRL